MFTKLNSIKGIISNGFCAGCGICTSMESAGEMSLSKTGFLRPVFKGNDEPASINAILQVCPGINIHHSKSTAGIEPIWGPLHTVRTGYANDAMLRKEGSSGGVISALADFLISKHAVDFVAQIAASPIDPMANTLQLSRCREDILRAAGSRYSPSAPLSRLHELLDSGARFAYVGKPCDIAAIRRLARVDQRINIQIPILISFMCAGIPSQQGTLEMLARMGVGKRHVVSLRYRGDGWPGKAKAVLEDGTNTEMDYNTSWGTILNRHLQFRCKICPDGTGEFADVVCADAWYGKDGYPDFTEREGRSLILSRTPAGEKLVMDAMAAGAISAEGLPVTEIARMQPYQLNRKQMVLGRLIATRLRLGAAPVYRGMGLLKASLTASPLAWLRSAWGTYKRAKGEEQ